MGEPILCRDEDAAARRGHRMLARCDGLVFFRIVTGDAGDVWTEVLATVGPETIADD